MSEKTEQPTPKKLRDARKKGQVASSKEVASTALILSILSYLWLMSGAIMDDLRDLMNVPIQLLDAPFGFALQQALAGAGSIMVRILAIRPLPTKARMEFMPKISNGRAQPSRPSRSTK